jgi:hypothetical protein
MHKADRRINVSWTAEWITYGPGREPENDGRSLVGFAKNRRRTGSCRANICKKARPKKRNYWRH